MEFTHGIRKNGTTRKHKVENNSMDIQKMTKIQRWKDRAKKNRMLCQVCGHISKSSGGARYHSLTHGEKLYGCHICPKKFFSASHLKIHVQYKHERKT